MNADSADTEHIWTLLRKHVPEVRSGAIKVLGISRKPGSRSALAVSSRDPRVDPVGVVVGHRGERVKRIIGELSGEFIDIIRWEESPERFIANLLCPLRLTEVSFEERSRRATVRVAGISESRRADLALRSELLMNLTGWRLQVE